MLRLPFILASFTLISIIGCKDNGTFDPMNCPGTQFPKAQDLLQKIEATNYSFYFSNIMSGTALFKFETWADQKFEYEASANYYYNNDNYLDKRCAKGIILRLKTPLNSDREKILSNYLNFLEKKTEKNLKPTFEKAKSYGQLGSFIGSFKTDLNSGHLLEISGFHHPARGDFIEAGWYETSYFQENFATPTNESGKLKTESK